MDYKKKYEKLVDAVKVLRDNNPSDKGIQNWVNDNVPELKESEDERIKKNCIHFLELQKQHHAATFEIEECIAWLEKQGEPNPYSGVSFKYNGHTWGMCARDNGAEILVDGELKAFVSLEKSFVYPIHPQPNLAPKSALEAIREEKVDNQNCVKSTDKVKPKFKDGDVVAGKNCACSYITIFRKIIDDTSFSHHACLTSLGRFKIDNFSDNAGLRLATEEEKQQLFDVIKENGYKWNPETKTLEKLVEPYKEETMEVKETLVKIDLTQEVSKAEEIEVILGDYEFVLKEGKTYFIKKKPKYPKTYEECCKILQVTHTEWKGYLGEVLVPFQKLLICRNAYWMIEGGWKFDFDKPGYYLCNEYGSIQKFDGTIDCGAILTFPTKEMRDAFYENFMELIETCKEFL